MKCKRVEGAGRKKIHRKLGGPCFSTLLMCGLLSAKVPWSIFKHKAQELQNLHINSCQANGLEYERIRFTNKWLKGWCKKLGISMRKPNKRYTISKETLKRRVIQFLKQVWTVRHYFNTKHGIEPVILGAEQMPLHRNEVGQLKTMAFAGSHRDVFVKENHSLSRERCTVMTCISSSNAVPPPPPEFLFKGAGKRVTLAKPAQ